MEELVRYIASTLVDHPEQVQVKTVDNPESVIIELSVGPDDMGKVIGKQGRIAKSIRSVVKAATARSEKAPVLPTTAATASLSAPAIRTTTCSGWRSA